MYNLKSSFLKLESILLLISVYDHNLIETHSKIFEHIFLGKKEKEGEREKKQENAKYKAV